MRIARAMLGEGLILLASEIGRLLENGKDATRPDLIITDPFEQELESIGLLLLLAESSRNGFADASANNSHFVCLPCLLRQVE